MDKVRVMRHGRVVQVPRDAPMVIEIGIRGMPGAPGEKGDAMTFDDLTPAQKEALKGEKGDPGDSQIEPINVAVIDNLF